MAFNFGTLFSIGQTAQALDFPILAAISKNVQALPR
jgi:hypothetical protein